MDWENTPLPGTKFLGLCLIGHILLCVHSDFAINEAAHVHYTGATQELITGQLSEYLKAIHTQRDQYCLKILPFYGREVLLKHPCFILYDQVNMSENLMFGKHCRQAVTFSEEMACVWNQKRCAASMPPSRSDRQFFSSVWAMRMSYGCHIVCGFSCLKSIQADEVKAIWRVRQMNVVEPFPFMTTLSSAIKHFCSVEGYSRVCWKGPQGSPQMVFSKNFVALWKRDYSRKAILLKATFLFQRLRIQRAIRKPNQKFLCPHP